MLDMLLDPSGAISADMLGSFNLSCAMIPPRTCKTLAEIVPYSMWSIGAK